MKRVLLVTAAFVAAVAVWIGFSLPPRTRALEASWDDGSVPGLIHIHSSKSDGRGSFDDIAAAAAAAGSKFVIVTDHGDGTRVPEAPSYRSGVLCIDAVEISTTGGHYVALGLPQAPYRLGGEPRDVVDDVRRMGGFGIAAHPDSPKPALAWSDWTVPVDGFEVLNPDSSWRAHAFERGAAGKARLLQALATYPFRPSETIGGLLTNSAELRARWDAEGDRRLVATAGVDAHSRIDLWESELESPAFSIPIPAYESAFKTLSVHVVPAGRLTGDAAADAARLLDAVRAGRLYVAIDAWASPALFEFTASNGGTTRVQGEDILSPDGAVTLKTRHNGPDSFVTTIHRNGVIVHEGRSPMTSLEVGADPATYRVEVRDPEHPDGPPWITSNPIRVSMPPAAAADAHGPAPFGLAALFDRRSTNGWATEMDSSSLAAINFVTLVSGPALRVRFGLSDNGERHQFAGVTVQPEVMPADADRVSFSIHSERPMRISVQARAPQSGGAGERWQRSIYVDETPRTVSVRFDDMRPVGETSTPTPPVSRITNIMFIVDTVNSLPGASGSFWLTSVDYAR